MTFKKALKLSQQGGSNRHSRFPRLASICNSLASVHAINASVWYDACVRLGLDGSDLSRIVRDDPARFAFLPWESD